MKKMKYKVFFISILTLFFAGVSAFGAGYEKVPTGKYFYVKSVQAGYRNLGYWDQPGKKRRYKKGANIAMYAKDNYIDQQFRFVSVGRGWYNIISRNGGYVNVDGGRTKNGTNLEIWSKKTSRKKISAQKFRFKHLGHGKWKIYTYSGRVICTPRKYKNGSNVHIWRDHNGPWMEWYFIDSRTNKKYSPKKAEKFSRKADFFIKNKNRAFKYTSSTLVGRNKGYAYVLRIEYNRNITLGIDYSGTDPRTGRKKKMSSIMKIHYNKGKYTSGPSGEFQLSGKADGNARRLSMGHSQGGVSFEVTRKSKKSVMPRKPVFFVKNRFKTFVYKSGCMSGHETKGTARVKRIRGNMIELSITSSALDRKTKKMKTTTRVTKLYYIDGTYTYNDEGYFTYGYASGSSRKLEISGEQDYSSFTVK